MEENLFVWPRSLTLAGEQRDLLRPIPLGAYGGTSRPVTTWDNEARLRVVRPLGQWNSIEVVSRDGGVEAYLNDTLISTVTGHGFTEPRLHRPAGAGLPDAVAEHPDPGGITAGSYCPR